MFKWIVNSFCYQHKHGILKPPNILYRRLWKTIHKVPLSRHRGTLLQEWSSMQVVLDDDRVKPRSHLYCKVFPIWQSSVVRQLLESVVPLLIIITEHTGTDNNTWKHPIWQGKHRSSIRQNFRFSCSVMWLLTRHLRQCMLKKLQWA